MDERENLIVKITEQATKKAKAEKMNEAQTKLYVAEEVKKALEEYDKTAKVVPTSLPTAENKKNDEVKPQTETKQAETKQSESKSEIKYIVHTPVKNYCGEVAGVQFAYGKAEVKAGWVLNWFKEHGYRVEEISQ